MVLVTVNPAFRASEVEYVLKQSRSSGVFVVSAFRGNPMLEIVRAVAPNYPELRQTICLDDWNAFTATGDNQKVKLPIVSPDDPVMIQYTSGTTGLTKGNGAKRLLLSFVRSPARLSTQTNSRPRAALAPHKTPKHYVDAFPLTGSGKIQKFKLRGAWIKGETTAI